jgi:hypothetical protein
MKTRIFFGSVLIMFLFSLPAIAGGKGEIQKYFSDAAKKVNAAESASEKRDILEKSFKRMFNALDKVQNSGFASQEESEGIDLFKATIKDRQDELIGVNGFERVADSQLNDYANFVVQDMEQASITISLLALVLIIILLVYLL